MVNEAEHDKNNKLTSAPSKDHPSSLIGAFAVRFIGSYGSKPSSDEQRKLIKLGGFPG